MIDKFITDAAALRATIKRLAVAYQAHASYSITTDPIMARFWSRELLGVQELLGVELREPVELRFYIEAADAACARRLKKGEG